MFFRDASSWVRVTTRFRARSAVFGIRLAIAHSLSSGHEVVVSGFGSRGLGDFLVVVHLALGFVGTMTLDDRLPQRRRDQAGEGLQARFVKASEVVGPEKLGLD